MKKLIYVLLFTLFTMSSVFGDELSDQIGDDIIHEYQVQKHDTLMIIGFKIYGDYRMWKELHKLNPQLKGKSLSVANVKTIKYKTPKKYFEWRPKGNPYLIKKGDSLSKISLKKYSTTQKWKDIYRNNKPLIRWPNLIFAGFTIFYIPEKKPVETISRLH
jgi:nucleoid-associated protein YgaU